MQLNPNRFLGIAIDAPYGFTTNQGGIPQASQQLGSRAAVKSIEANPVLGYKVNDMISIAAGPRVLWLQGKFNRSLFGLPSGGPLLLNAPVDLVVDDIGYGFTAGITVTPTPWTELSLGYRSQVHLNLDGHNTFATSAALAASPATAPFNGTTNNLTSSETLPDQVTFGVSQRITETFKLLGTVEWTHWSILQNIPFTFTSGPAPGTTATTLNFNFRDGWFFSLGAEYKVDPQTTARVGVGYEIAPVTDQFRDVNLPGRKPLVALGRHDSLPGQGHHARLGLLVHPVPGRADQCRARPSRPVQSHHPHSGRVQHLCGQRQHPHPRRLDRPALQAGARGSGHEILIG